ncbi:PepSY domain-containing protein [bacterium]|nr:PepSY domain-containing protein [bacterium]
MKNITAKILFAIMLLTFCCAGAISTAAYADDDHEGYYVREEAARRNIRLISIEQAKRIASQRIGSGNLRFKEIELENEADDYPSPDYFRPVYKIECVTSSFREYDVDIDAVTGQVLKCKYDD